MNSFNVKHDGKYALTYNAGGGESSVRVTPEFGAAVVRAVNAHEDMLAVCKMAEQTFNATEIDPLIAFAVIEKLRAAIQKAEGK